MSDTIAAATASMLADLERLRTIGQNFANAATTGYKAEYAVSKSHEQFADVLAAGDPSALVQLAVDSRPGALRQTDRRLDVALDGPGYFQIETADGVRYTRRGDFQLGADGVLQTRDGHAVLGAAGVLRLVSDLVQIDRTGTVRHEDRLLGTLAAVTFAQPGDVVHEGNGIYRSDAVPASADPAATTIRQGYLEAANVQPVNEMVRLMETVRHFGLTAQALRAHDAMLEAGINRLGEF